MRIRRTISVLTLVTMLLALTVGVEGALAAPPEILDVVIDRGCDTDWWDWTCYHARFQVRVQGTADDLPVYLLIEDMQGSRYVIALDGSSWYDPGVTNLGGSSDVRVWADLDHTYEYVWYEARKPGPIPAGSYTFTVVGTSTTWPSLTTPVLPAVPASTPVLTAPGAEGAISTTTPTLAWSDTSGSKTMLQVRAEGAVNYNDPRPEVDDAGEIWRADVTGESSVVYNFDVSGPDLDPGRTYFWEVSDWFAVDDRVTDPRVSVWAEQTARHRFTVSTTWPALPSLPGKLAYEHTMFGQWLPYNLQAILQYGTTLAERKWIGPDASHTPCYSWDGSLLAYRISDVGIFLDSQDGSPPYQVPNVIAWDNASLSPDGTRVTYSDSALPGTPPLHIYSHNLDGTGRTLLAEARGTESVAPVWSPDGKWIAYTSINDPSGNWIWLVRPDGTDDHAVIPTSVAGYMDATITYVGGSPRWSPDAKQLGVDFSLLPDAGEEVSGVGVISIDGGEITPIWVSPPGYVCCASPSFGTWSPDGGSIVFTSAHHLPFDADWELGKFESGAELWLIDADGTGPPTRLTYDFSHPWAPAWWAPNTPATTGVTITKGDATITFADVAVEGSTSVCIVPQPPGPAPEDYELVGSCWVVLTDATASEITVELGYGDPTVDPDLVPAVRLLGWVDGQWTDITTGLDTASEIVTGYAPALSYFTVAIVEQFGDVSDEHWAFGAINTCVIAGVVAGYGDGLYHPEYAVTRDQMAVYIARALAGGDDNVPEFTESPTFPDVGDGFWALDHVEYAVSHNVVAGYQDGYYHPMYQVDRGTMAVYIARARGWVGLDDDMTTAPELFPDVPAGFWSGTAIEACVTNGVVQGYLDGNYYPYNIVTRDQMAVYVARAFGLVS